MATFYTILTDVGQAKLANAIALGQTIEITELAVGDGNGSLPTPETDRTALVNEVRRAPINLSEVDEQNPNWVVVEQVLPPDVGGWTIREIGVFDVEGDLIGYGNYPETYKPVLAEGSSRTQTIRFVMEVSDTEAVTLKVDPSVVLATRGYADNLMDEHEASRNHPLATTTEKGMVEKATATEAKTGASDKFPDAAAMRAAIDDGMAYQNIQVFDSAGTYSWSVPQALQDGRRKAHVIVIGGGGSGGKNDTDGATGGSGGGSAIDIINLLNVANVDVTVGAGGSRLSTNGNGINGGSSSFGPFTSATGGLGGLESGGAPVSGGTAAATNGISVEGGYGGKPRPETGGLGPNGGYGGNTLLGHGGAGGVGGQNGKGYGSGGAGSYNGDSGRGADGLVIIRW